MQSSLLPAVGGAGIGVSADDSSWAVVGGGMMGMTLALRLAQRGQDVRLIEAGDQLGGLVAPWQLGDIAVWDRFYHVIVNVDAHLLALLRELDLESQVRWVGTRTGFYADGRLHSMSSSLEFLTFPPLSIYQKLRLGLTILYGANAGDWRQLENVPLETWLRKVSGASTFERIWLPLLRAKLGENYRRTAASFIWAYIRRMYSARQNGLKREQFGYVPGGYGTIVESLRRRLVELGVEISVNTGVSEIRSVDARFEIVGSDGETATFDRVISTLPPRATGRLCPQLSARERELSDGVDYIGVVCPSLLLSQPLSPYYVTNILDDWVPLTGVIESTTVVDTAELGGHALVYLPQYVSENDDTAFDESDAAIEERCLGVLERMYPSFSREHVAAFQVARARRVMALPTLGYSKKLPPQRTTLPGLFAINSAYILSGVLNVDSTLAVAEKAFEELLLPEL